MKSKVLEKVINLIREEMMAAGTGGFSGSADSKGPVAGFDPVMKKMTRRKKTVGLWAGSLKKKKK